MSDLGLTHIALAVKDLDASLAFYERYAAMRPVHRRASEHGVVAWITDFTRPFAIVLVQAESLQERPLGPFGHLGVACASPAEVDRLAGLARDEQRLISGPTDFGPPVGYYAMIRDPDGNTLEVAYGQEVAFTIDGAQG